MSNQKHLRLTILCENTVGNLRGIGEHGLSVYIETDKGDCLFDTGSGVGLLPNALTFGKDLRRIKKIIVSHGHYDHTGGLRDVLGITGPVDVHAHPAIFDDKYAISQERGKALVRYIGIPHKREALVAAGGNFRLDRGFSEIDDGVYFTGEVPRFTSYEVGDVRLHVKRGEDYAPDEVPDDGALVVTTEKGLVVVLGCAHAGTVNTLEYVRGHFPGEPVCALIGGTHWGFLPADAVDVSVKRVKEMDVGAIGVCHCTGIAVASRLAGEFGERYFYASVGTVFEV